ncbi:hypothetical protein MHYP_G00262670 [Metynnis hypsauchen]
MTLRPTRPRRRCYSRRKKQQPKSPRGTTTLTIPAVTVPAIRAARPVDDRGVSGEEPRARRAAARGASRCPRFVRQKPGLGLGHRSTESRVGEGSVGNWDLFPLESPQSPWLGPEYPRAPYQVRYVGRITESAA